MLHSEAVCPMCGHDQFTIEEPIDEVYTSVSMQVCCQRCETECTMTFSFWYVHEVTVTQPYGPEYLTSDARQALLAYESTGGDTDFRSNGTQFVVGYEPWLRFSGYSAREGWRPARLEDVEVLGRLQKEKTNA